MTFNGLSWGYIDSQQVKAYSYSPQQIIRMLASSKVDFEQDGYRVILKNLPSKNPDLNVGIPVFELVFDKKPNYR